MATCTPCAEGNHDQCIEENKDRLTGCPACCQHRKNCKVLTLADGTKVIAPEGVTRIDVR